MVRAVAIAIGAAEPRVRGAVRVRRAGPPVGGGAVQVCDALVICAGSGPQLEVCQFCAVFRQVAPRRLTAHFNIGEQKHFGAQTICAAVDSHAGAGAGAVGNLGLLDLVADVCIDQVEEGAVEVAVDGAAGIIIDVGTVPLAVFVDVLHQEPGAVAALIVDVGRLALVDYDEVPQGTADFDFNDTSYGFGAKCGGCH